MQESIANTLTQTIATICGGIASVPIPVADIGPITGLQITLITVIAYVGGRQIGLKTAVEFLTSIGVNVGAGVVLKEVARAIVIKLS